MDEHLQIVAMLTQAIGLLEQARERCGLPPATPARDDAVAFGGEQPLRGEGRIVLYWAGCAGLANVARELGTRVSKLGTTTDLDITGRFEVLGRDKYGAWHRRAGRLIQDTGFERWIAQAIRITRGSIDPAVAVRTRTIEVLLPPGLTRRKFDRGLQTGLEAWRLERRHPQAQRFTSYSIGTQRLSRADEFYVDLDPRHDGDRLLEIVEKILRDHRARGDARGATRFDPAAVETVAVKRSPTASADVLAKHPMKTEALRAMIARRRSMPTAGSAGALNNSLSSCRKRRV